jgi:hypothetical protein
VSKKNQPSPIRFNPTLHQTLFDPAAFGASVIGALKNGIVKTNLIINFERPDGV